MSVPTPDPDTPTPAAPVAARPRPADSRRVVILTALGLVLVVLVGLLLLLPDGDEGSPAAATPSATATPTVQPTEPVAETPAPEELSPEELQAQRDALFTALVRRDPADVTAQGAVDAPVVMIVWADFRCGYCARFAVETAPGLADYVADGTLRIEWRDYPVITAQSPAIAAAARAAGVQGQFWEYHDRVFADHATVEVMDDDYLRGVAADLGLDVAQFDVDRASVEVATAVDTDAREAQSIGVRSTPTFFINGSPIMGAQPLEAYVTVIEAELARATG